MQLILKHMAEKIVNSLFFPHEYAIVLQKSTLTHYMTSLNVLELHVIAYLNMCALQHFHSSLTVRCTKIDKRHCTRIFADFCFKTMRILFHQSVSQLIKMLKREIKALKRIRLHTVQYGFESVSHAICVTVRQYCDLYMYQCVLT